jgi:outer membrane protein OmpA-like peptidoglycan-associated protein
VAIGAGFGALTGGLIGNEVDNQEAALAERDERLRSQEAQLEENRRLIAALRGRGVDVRATDRGVVINLPDVLFEFNRSRLTGEARRTVREIAEIARTTGDRRIAVEGHTDSIGSIAYNKRLSVDRARAVADELVAEGVSGRRILIRGLGESEPVASNATEAGRARNRRVEVIIENR